MSQDRFTHTIFRLSELLMDGVFMRVIPTFERKTGFNALYGAIVLYGAHFIAMILYALSGLSTLQADALLFNQSPTLGLVSVASDVGVFGLGLTIAYGCHRIAMACIHACRRRIASVGAGRQAGTLRYDAKLSRARVVTLRAAVVLTALGMVNHTLFASHAPGVADQTFLNDPLSFMIASLLLCALALHIHCASANPPPRTRNIRHAALSHAFR